MSGKPDFKVYSLYPRKNEREDLDWLDRHLKETGSSLSRAAVPYLVELARDLRKRKSAPRAENRKVDKYFAYMHFLA